MKKLTLLILLLLSNFVHGQNYFDGLLHETVGAAEYRIVEDSLFVVSMNIEEESGVDVSLGKTKGFGFTFAAIDPILNPNGAYQEWRMIGAIGDEEGQLLWKETHRINNQEGLIRTEVTFDTSPIGAEANGIKVTKNNELVHEGIYDVGLIYTIEVDTSIVSIAAICEPRCIPAKWDATCVAMPIIHYLQSIKLPDGVLVKVDEGELVEIETYAINPVSAPSFCSKIESRSYQLETSQFHTEGIIMFEERVPFYEIGNIVYEADLDFLKILEIDNSGTEGVRIPLDKASSFELSWMPISDYENEYSIELSSKGLVGQEVRTLGKVMHQTTATNEQFLITADFSSLDTENKTIQILKDGVLVQEFINFSNNEIAFLNKIPTSCGKLAQVAVDPPGSAVCYFMEFDEEAVFEVQGLPLRGNEIRILSTTQLAIEYLSESSLLLSGLPEIVIVGVDYITTRIDQVEYVDNLVDVFPNPARDEINIVFDYESGGGYSYLIYDSNGRLVLQGEMRGGNVIVDMSYLMNGMYYLQIKDDSSSRLLPAMSKIIKIN